MKIFTKTIVVVSAIIACLYAINLISYDKGEPYRKVVREILRSDQSELDLKFNNLNTTAYFRDSVIKNVNPSELYGDLFVRNFSNHEFIGNNQGFLNSNGKRKQGGLEIIVCTVRSLTVNSTVEFEFLEGEADSIILNDIYFGH